MKEEHRWMVAAAGALLGAGIGFKFGRQWIRDQWARVLLGAAVGGGLAFAFGHSANLAMRAGKLLGRMLH